MEKRNKHFFYVLECKDGSFYGGYTTDIDRRFQEHNEGKGAKYTRYRNPVKLIYYKEFVTKTEAMRAEYAFKQLNRLKKEHFLKEAGQSNAATKEFYE
ncbi:MAG: GIY-YIG nuclease family protein [Heyndrickxia sp.]